MKTPSYEQICERAYSIWEREGRVFDHQQSIANWIRAEHELQEEMQHDENASSARSSSSDNTRRGKNGAGREAATGANRGGEVEVAEMDRALPPHERAAARRQRRGDTTEPSDRPEGEHYLVVADRARLRIYREKDGQSGGPLEVAASFDWPEGKQSYTDRDTSQAGRFPGSRGAGKPGGSIDERLPMLEEHQRRCAKEIAAQLETFLKQHPRATWDYAAGPGIHHAVLELLHEDTRQRLGHAVMKDLVREPLPQLREHFPAELGQR